MCYLRSNFISVDVKFMQRAIELAQLGACHVSPNPLVGAIVVYNGKIIGEGFHRKLGTAHAEVNAINSVKDKTLLPKSTIYVTLEPCAHYGKTPPCVDLILKHNIPHVVIGCLDPNPLVAGKSVAKLQKNGVKVDTECMHDPCRYLARYFFTAFEKKRPHIVLKYAQSQDGFIGKEGKSVWLSNSLSKRWVHQLRSEVDGILVGKNTAILDNPKLNTRFGFGQSPRRIFLGTSPTDLLENDIVFDEHHPISYYNLLAILEILLKEGIQSLLIEGGATVLQAFIDAGYWDEAHVITAPIHIGSKGIQAPILSGKIKSKITLDTDIKTHIVR